MTNRIRLLGLFLWILASAFNSTVPYGTRAAPLADGKTLILYDATSGMIPDTSLMGFTDFPPGGSSLTYADGAAVLDTTVSGTDTYAGWVSSQATTSAFPLLDPAGVQLNFTLQVENETHSNHNRAGFSIILLDQNAKGIELSFWTTEIWVQNDDRTGGLFRHGEGATFSTTQRTDYQLTIAEDIYTLTANAKPVLTGSVRDYSGFEGFPDPYQTPNFLFLGDDTTAAQARVHLFFLSITGAEPVIPTIETANTGTGLTASAPTPVSNASSLPSQTPAPTRPGLELCPSGWLLSAVILGVAIKSIRRRSTNLF